MKNAVLTGNNKVTSNIGYSGHMSGSLWFWLQLQRYTHTPVSIGVFHGWWRGSVVRASVFDWWTFPDMRLIYGWRVTTSWVRRLLWVNQLGQLSLLRSVRWGMSSISIVRWVTTLAAVSPSSECLYERKADVVYLQVTLCDPHLSA